jgi:hypothetical protein
MLVEVHAPRPESHPVRPSRSVTAGRGTLLDFIYVPSPFNGPPQGHGRGRWIIHDRSHLAAP